VSTEKTVKLDDGRPAPRASDSEVGQVLWTLWATYGAFYFCRQNISAAVPGIEKDPALGYSGLEIGVILGALKVAYALGQLVNGQLAEQLSPRRLLGMGMLGSALLNVIFGFSTGLYFLLFVWACNGYCQALGWTPCMRVAANWFPVHRRGWLIGVLGTSYQVGASLTFVIAGWSAQWLGWRGAFYVPAALLAAAGLHMLLFLRESPADDGTDSTDPVRAAARGGDWRQTLRDTLSNPALWLLAVTLGLLDACRYGFQDWGLSHLVKVQGTGVGVAGLKFAVLPLGGIPGALVAGWATDRFLAGRRAPFICGMLVLLGVLTLAYEPMARTSLAGTVLLLVLIGFAIFGAQVLLVGTAPADLARRGTAAAAAGFVNFMGYMGAAAGDVVTGYLRDAHGWHVAIWAWAVWAFLGAVTVSFLWNATARSPKSGIT
jgi:sugar phosphate permease